MIAPAHEQPAQRAIKPELLNRTGTILSDEGLSGWLFPCVELGAG